MSQLRHRQPDVIHSLFQSSFTCQLLIQNKSIVINPEQIQSHSSRISLWPNNHHSRTHACTVKGMSQNLSVFILKCLKDYIPTVFLLSRFQTPCHSDSQDLNVIPVIRHLSKYSAKKYYWMSQSLQGSARGLWLAFLEYCLLRPLTVFGEACQYGMTRLIILLYHVIHGSATPARL